MKILLAVDGSENSLLAADAVAQRPWPPNSSLKILSVIKLPFTPSAETSALPESEYGRMEKAARQQAEESVSAALTRIQDSNTAREASLATTIEILFGQPQDVILEQADEWGADLIVIGSRGLSGVKRFLLGSVSNAVATYANCSVEIVRPPRTAE